MHFRRSSGSLWRIEDTCKSRSELDIYAALDKLFLDISEEEEGRCAEGFGLAESAAAWGGTKRYKAENAMGERGGGRHSSVSEGPSGEGAIYGSLQETSIGKWHVVNRTGGASLKTWAAREAVNCVLISQELVAKLEISEIIPSYAEYMGVERTPSLGLSIADCCLSYEPQSDGERQGRITTHVPKDPARNIYTYIARPH